MSDITNHLTTGKSSRSDELFRDIPFRELVLIVIAVTPRYQRTGLLDEQNVWIKNLWNKVLEAFPQVIGCRVLWNTLFFVLDAQKHLKPETVFEKILADSYNKDLKSLFLSRTTEGGYPKILRDFDELQEETSSELNFGKAANIRVRIVDGRRLTIQRS